MYRRDSHTALHELQSVREREVRLLLRRMRRKQAVLIVSLLIILIVPQLFDRHLPFNTLYHTTLADFDLFPDTLDVPIAYPLILLAFFYALMLIFKERRVSASMRSVSSLKLERSVGRFDIVSFASAVLAGYVVVNAFFFSFATISGHSMEPTFHDGDNIIMSHTDDDYERFDLVVAAMEYTADTQFYIKRVVGLPGEKVVIDEGDLEINEEPLEEPFLPKAVPTECPGIKDTCSFSLGEDEYFLLGDNREHSTDSRILGPFDGDDIYGTVQFRFTPIHAAGRVD